MRTDRLTKKSYYWSKSIVVIFYLYIMDKITLNYLYLCIWINTYFIIFAQHSTAYIRIIAWYLLWHDTHNIRNAAIRKWVKKYDLVRVLNMRPCGVWKLARNHWPHLFTSYIRADAGCRMPGLVPSFFSPNVQSASRVSCSRVPFIALTSDLLQIIRIFTS